MLRDLLYSRKIKYIKSQMNQVHDGGGWRINYKIAWEGSILYVIL